MNYIDEVNNNWVCQSNEFIETTCFHMTTMEQKIIRILASMVKKGDNEFKEYNFKISSLCESLKINKKNIYRELDKASTLLMTRHIKIRDKSNENKWYKYHIIKTAKCDDGLFIIKIDSEMKNFYLELQEFTRYRLNNVLEFNHTFSFKIYELLKRNEYRKTVEVSLKNLKESLCIQDKYKIYADFKKRVLIPVQDEVSKKTDLCFNYKEIKKGRKIETIKFLIKKNKVNSNQTNIKEIEEIVKEYKTLYNGDLVYEKVEKLVDLKGFDCVKECLKEAPHYLTSVNQALFMKFAEAYGTENAYKKINNCGTMKPVQSTNYEQRKYEDDFFNSLYDNAPFESNKKES